MISVCGLTIQYSGNTAFGVVAALLNEISFRLLFAYNFKGQVSAEPEPIFTARIRGRK